MAQTFNNGPGSSELNETEAEPDVSLVCKDTEEIRLFEHLSYGPFTVDSTFGSEDGRFIFLVRFYSIIALEIESGKSW
jgi:hypothetical protein